MPTPVSNVETLATQEYKYGFYTDIEADLAPAGLNEDIIRQIGDEIEVHQTLHRIHQLYLELSIGQDSPWYGSQDR